MYDETTIERLQLIKQLQNLGLSLQEIDAMLRATGEHATCAHESGKIRAALARTEEQIASLASVQQRLRGALRRCERGECTLLAQVSKVARNPTVGHAQVTSATRVAGRGPRNKTPREPS